MQHVEVENLGGRMTTKVKPAKPLKSYHFSLGNSAQGPVGYCARILATSKKAAIARLRKLLPESQTMCGIEVV